METGPVWPRSADREARSGAEAAKVADSPNNHKPTRESSTTVVARTCFFIMSAKCLKLQPTLQALSFLQLSQNGCGELTESHKNPKCDSKAKR
eukprot:737953-Amphidinium_carterae.2